MKQTTRFIKISSTVLAAAVLLTGCSESIVNAGYNTLLGMGMAFCVLIIISLVISVFPLIGKIGEGKKEAEQMRIDAIDKTVGQIAEKEERKQAAQPAAPDADDGELIAVFAAAIAAYEADMQTGYTAHRTAQDVYIDDFDPDRDYGTFRARPIRRVRGSSAWKKA